MYKCNCGREFKTEQIYNMHKPYCKGAKYCQNPECKKLLIDHQVKFCSASCAAKVNNIGKKHSIETRKKISKSLGGKGTIRNGFCINCGNTTSNLKYCSEKCSSNHKHNILIEKWITGEISGTTISGHSSFVKTYLKETYGNKCSICRWSKINKTTGNVPVEVDHIDGNHQNNHPDNVRLLCPNCHSLTPTYKALNKGNGRSYRK